MSIETLVAERLHELAGTAETAGTADLVTRALGAGQRRRRHRRAVLGAVGAASTVTCAVLAGGLVTLGRGGAPAGAGTIDPAATSTAAPAQAQAAPYWHLRVVTTATSLYPDGQRRTTSSTTDTYDGHGRPGVERIDGRNYPLAPYLDTVTDRHVRYAAGVQAPALLGWDDMWSLPRTPAGLTAYWQQRRGGSDIDEFGKDLVHRPGPDAMHRAAADLLAALPDVRTTTGHDSTGRAARILTRVRYGQTDVVYVDPSTGAELERDVTPLVTPTLPVPRPGAAAPTGGPLPSSSIGLSRRDIYTIDGPSAKD